MPVRFIHFKRIGEDGTRTVSFPCFVASFTIELTLALKGFDREVDFPELAETESLHPVHTYILDIAHLQDYFSLMCVLYKCHLTKGYQFANCYHLNLLRSPLVNISEKRKSVSTRCSYRTALNTIHGLTTSCVPKPFS